MTDRATVARRHRRRPPRPLSRPRRCHRSPLPPVILHPLLPTLQVHRPTQLSSSLASPSSLSSPYATTASASSLSHHAAFTERSAGGSLQPRAPFAAPASVAWAPAPHSAAAAALDAQLLHRPSFALPHTPPPQQQAPTTSPLVGQQLNQQGLQLHTPNDDRQSETPESKPSVSMQRHPPPRFPGLSLTLVDQSHVLRGPTTSSTTSPTTASTPSLFSSSATLSPSSSSPLDSPQSGIHRHPPPYGDSQWVSRQFSPPSSSPELSPVAMGRSISLPSRISSRSPPPPFSEKTKPPPLLFSPPSPEQLKAPEFPEKSCSLGAVGDGTRGALIPAENVSPLRTHLMWNMFYWSPDLWNSLLPPPKRDANGRMNFLPRSSSRDPRNIGVRPTPVLETITHSWNVFQTGILTFGRSTEADLRAIKAARRVKFRSADDVWRLPPSQPSSSDDSADGTTERKGPKPPKIVIPGPQIRMLSSPVDEEEDEDMPLRHGQMLSTFLATHGREFPGVSFYSSQQAEAPATAPTAPSGGTASRSPSATRSPRQPRPPLNRPAPVRAGSIYIPKDALGPAAVNAFTGPSVPAGNAASISPGAAAVFSMFSQSNLLLDARTGRSPTSNFAAMSVSPTAASGRDPVVDTGSTNSSASPRLLVPNGPTFDDVMEAAQFWSSRPAEQSPVDVLMRRASPTSPSVGPFSPIISPASARAGR